MEHIYMQESFGQNWFTYPNLYSSMVKTFPSGSKFVEVGSWKGRSSSYMSVEIANSGKKIDFYCVDHWLGNDESYDPSSHAYEPEIDKIYQIFTNNMESLKDFYIPIRMNSLDASGKFPNRSLDFVFIDASHDYENVKKDIIAWAPKIKDGGILSGHDIEHEPVKRAVNDTIGEFNYEISEYCWIVKNIDSIKNLR